MKTFVTERQSGNTGVLEDAGNHAVPHLPAVLRPVVAVLLAALDVVAEGSVHEQQREPDEVGIHHDVRK